METGRRILLSRFLTRSGDQAWDFAIPLLLMELFPAHMRMAFLYFFTVKIGSVLLMPYMGRLIDRRSRIESIRLGIGIQAGSVTGTLIIMYFLARIFDPSVFTISGTTLYCSLLILGLLSNLGTNIMDISVANDLVPATLHSSKLPAFNSRLRQLDLLTEVLSTVVAGLLLLISPNEFQLLGFFIIGGWNLISFYPEFFLLRKILDSHPNLNVKQFVPSGLKATLVQKLRAGWGEFTKLPVSGAMLAYAILWLSVLSPHGVLLTAFLKGGWKLSEPAIGTFRSLGAVFGLGATVIYPILRNKLTVPTAARHFLVFQALMLLLSLFSFYEDSQSSQYIFLIAILFSRIGLYGFGLAEMELRQTLIPEALRGEINGVGSALNSFATLVIFSLGLIFSSPENFKYLVLVSTLAVIMSAIYFSFFVLHNIARTKKS